jgi:hypothetical protein
MKENSSPNGVENPNASKNDNKTPTPGIEGIHVDHEEMLNLPVSVELKRCQGILWLCGKDPFTQQQWFNILSKPPTLIPANLLEEADPFYWDVQYFQTHETETSFYRTAIGAELSTLFWQKIGVDRTVRAVVVMKDWGIMEKYFISLPQCVQEAEAIKDLRIHAATVDTFDGEVLTPERIYG